jgi:hypothetical protein
VPLKDAQSSFRLPRRKSSVTYQSRSGFAVRLAFLAVFFPATLVSAQNSASNYEVGVIYYAAGTDFRPLVKEVSILGGHVSFNAKVKGAHAQIRLPADQPSIFRLCSADPSRFKLYRFKSEANARSMILFKSNVFIGGVKTVVQESEIALAVKKVDADCFTLTPNQNLEGGGEFGFSPDGSLVVFLFGVGDIKDYKRH